jgi:hypothetical protein
MNKNYSMDENRWERSAKLQVMFALAVAIFGVLAMLVIDHGPWTRPNVQTGEVANHETTGAAARIAGAKVTPTVRKPEIEPEAPGPKPAQPADVVAPKS